MPRCQIEKASSETAYKAYKPFAVDMFACAASSGDPPLYTYGFGPCMCLIVHNCDGSTGAMAHVAGGNSSPFEHMTLLTKYMITAIDQPGEVEIIMLEGSDYRDKHVKNFLCKFKIAMGPTANTIHYVDMRERTDMNSALYLPTENKVIYSIETLTFDEKSDKNKVIKVQNSKITGLH